MKDGMIVMDGGSLSTIQDAGRPGFRRYGIPRSGAMDLQNYHLANWLAGNPPGEACIECNLKGGKYLMAQDAVIALTGAPIKASVNDEPLPYYQSIPVRMGDVLTLGYPEAGMRTYLAVQGTWDVHSVLGSKSTYTRGGFGGMEGRALQKKDVIRWSRSEPIDPERTLEDHLRPHFPENAIIRLIRGPEFDWMTEEMRESFESREFLLSSQSDRMGIRLECEPLEVLPGRSMLSSATLPGTIQLPYNGKPIVLMQDAQTSGGYPRIGKVIDFDLGRMSQLTPNARLRFKFVDIDEARRHLQDQRSFWRNLFPAN